MKESPGRPHLPRESILHLRPMEGPFSSGGKDTRAMRLMSVGRFCPFYHQPPPPPCSIWRDPRCSWGVGGAQIQALTLSSEEALEPVCESDAHDVSPGDKGL